MANPTYEGFEPRAQAQAAEPGAVLFSLSSWIGAIISVGLIVGLVLWGYRLSVRDVTEVPVIRAFQEPMRDRPENPGGEIALNQGLSVNSVQAQGTVSKPASQVVLAPAPVTVADAQTPIRTPRRLTLEDPITAPAPVLAEPSRAPSASDVTAATLAALGSSTDSQPTGSAAAITVMTGIASSPRPAPRPQARQVASAGTTAAQAAPGPSIDVDPASVAPGTRLVQLGAFDDRPTAEKEWTRITGLHPDLLGGKKRLIQKAESGGRSFYRLRAVGFEGLSETRRLCSALVARNTPCIPVSAR